MVLKCTQDQSCTPRRGVFGHTQRCRPLLLKARLTRPFLKGSSCAVSGSSLVLQVIMFRLGGSFQRVPMSGLQPPISSSDGSYMCSLQNHQGLAHQRAPGGGRLTPDVRAVTCMCHIGVQRCADVPLKTDGAEDAC